jgi:hypothetical protein
MKSIAGCVVLCVTLPLSLAACGGTDAGTVADPLQLDSAVDPAESTERAQAIEGILGQVDLVTMTFTLADDPSARIFLITDETDVTGMSSAQGLAGREGARVTVHYREDAGEWIATRILLE